MRVVKIIFGVFCLGIGVAFAIGTADGLLHPNPYSTDLPASWLGMFAAMFLVGSYLLLRRSPSPLISPGPASPGPASPGSRRFKSIMLNSGALLAVFGSLGIYLLVHQASVNQQKAEQTQAQQQAEDEQYEQRATTAIRRDELSLTKVSLTNTNWGWVLSGIVTNNSKFDLLRLDFLVTIKDCTTNQECKIIGQETTPASADLFDSKKPLVPAGQMREFSAANIKFPNMPSVSKRLWEYIITQIRAAPVLLSDEQVGIAPPSTGTQIDWDAWPAAKQPGLYIGK